MLTVNVAVLKSSSAHRNASASLTRSAANVHASITGRNVSRARGEQPVELEQPASGTGAAPAE